MTLRPAVLAALTLALLSPAAASAGEDPFGDPVRHRVRADRVHRTLPPLPRAAVFTGYLPRTTGLPMYNEPLRRGPTW